MEPNLMSRQAAMVAVSNAVASRFALGTTGMHRRGPAPSGVAARLLPVPLHLVPSLSVSPERAAAEGAASRLTRYATAASLYTLERKEGGFARQVLRGRGELDVLSRVAALDKNKNRSCAYCRLLNGLLYHRPLGRKWGDQFPPVEPVNHEARITPTFDPDTSVSNVVLTKQQWLVRGPERAKQLVLVLHPLLWHETNPDLFRATDPARPRQEGGFGPSWERDLDPSEDLVGRFHRWNRARDNPRTRSGYLWEIVAWPWNQNLSAEVQNIIRVDRQVFFAAPDLVELEFDYALEECLESNFGVAFERSGLDVDGGRCELTAKPISKLELSDVAHLTVRDLAHLGVGYGDDPATWRLYASPEQLVEPTTDGDKQLLNVEALEAVRKRADALQHGWGGDQPWLVTSTLTKRFRFTAPLNGPIELWSALNFSAPALLVMFMNRAASLPAHLVGSGDISPNISRIAATLP